MSTLYAFFTVAFIISCLVSVVSTALKLLAFRAQLQTRRDGVVAYDTLPKDQKRKQRLIECQKQQKQVYANVLTVVGEGSQLARPLTGDPHSFLGDRDTLFADLPFAILTIFLTNSLPADQGLGLAAQLSMYWSWMNFGGPPSLPYCHTHISSDLCACRWQWISVAAKFLKASTLPQLWTKEKRLRRKIAGASTASDGSECSERMNELSGRTASHGVSQNSWVQKALRFQAFKRHKMPSSEAGIEVELTPSASPEQHDTKKNPTTSRDQQAHERCLARQSRQSEELLGQC